MIDHHPYDEMLLDFATGAQPQAVSLAVGGHLRYCPACRGVVDDLEAVGGELIRRIEPAAIREDALAACLARLGEPQAEEPDAAPPPPPELQYALGSDCGGGPRDLPWASVGGFFDEVKLLSPSPGYRVSILRVAPGRHVPEHGHEGNEYMLVLAGGYRSGGRHFQIGDFAACDGSEDHTPIADEGGDCICLLVLDAPLAFRTVEGARLGPLLAT